MTAVWAGIDAGKRAHHCVVIDSAGRLLLSRRVVNDESALLELIAAVLAVAGGDPAVWATDLNAGGAALLIALLAERGQQVLYIPGRIVHHAAATYRGDGKTDAKDARIIADQARMRTDLQPVRGGDQISTDLRLLTARRTDLAYDRVRAINRLRATLLEFFPALEAAFDYSKKAPLILLSGYQTPEAIRRIGAARLAAWLKKRGCRGSVTVARKAWTPPAPSAPCCGPRRWARSSSPSSRSRSPSSTLRSLSSTSRSASGSASTPTPRSCSACPASVPSWRQPSSRTPAVTSARSRPSTGSPASPASPRRHVIPAGSAATTTAPAGSTGG